MMTVSRLKLVIRHFAKPVGLPIEPKRFELDPVRFLDLLMLAPAEILDYYERTSQLTGSST